MLSEHRDMVAAQAFFCSAKDVTGITPDQVATDGHRSYPRAICSTLRRRVMHRTSAYKNNNRLEQDHRGVKGRTRCRLWGPIQRRRQLLLRRRLLQEVVERYVALHPAQQVRQAVAPHQVADAP